MTSRSRLRPAGADDLGLRRASSDRMLPLLVGAMAFLAALALAGLVAASALSAHWQRGAAAALTVQVPDPGVDGRGTKVLETVRGTPGVLEARMLDNEELQSLLRPWLGSGPGQVALPLPGVIAVRLADSGLEVTALAARLRGVAAGTLVEAQDVWIRRLSVLARSLQACAGLAMGVVGCVAVAVVMVATRAGLSARREAIEIVHGLGATDRFIAGRFADRATRLAGVGAAAGAVLALPVLLGLTGLAAPFSGGDAAGPGDLSGLLEAMPPVLWIGLAGLPVVAAAVGWVTAQTTVPAMAAAAALTRVRTWLGWCAGVVLGTSVLWLTGFTAFENTARRPVKDAPAADAIVALTGGADRIDTALTLLLDGRAPLLLISGVGHGTELAGLEHRIHLSAEQAARVTLGRAATSTFGNAEETAAWARSHDVHTLIVVTAGYHMPRSLVEIGRALPGVRLYPVAVQPPALRRGVDMATLRILVTEYDKYLAVRFGMTRKKGAAGT